MDGLLPKVLSPTYLWKKLQPKAGPGYDTEAVAASVAQQIQSPPPVDMASPNGKLMILGVAGAALFLLMRKGPR